MHALLNIAVLRGGQPSLEEFFFDHLDSLLGAHLHHLIFREHHIPILIHFVVTHGYIVSVHFFVVVDHSISVMQFKSVTVYFSHHSFECMVPAITAEFLGS